MEGEPKSVFLEQEGFTPKNRVWDFLIVHAEFDYSMKDIAKYAGISYSSLKRIWPGFIGMGIVKQTRTVGKAKMFQLDKDNPIVEAFINYFWAVVESVVGKGIAEEKQLMKKASTRKAAAKR